MVKKIRVIDDTPDEGPMGNDRDLMEMAKTMDWKLWEILQIMQRLENLKTYICPTHLNYEPNFEISSTLDHRPRSTTPSHV